MVDTSNWHGLPDVQINNDAADLLASGCEDAAKLIRDQVSGRRTATTNAMQDFDGLFSEIFQQNQDTANSDGGEIATALDEIATAVRYIVSIVPAENDRRRAAREWAERRKEDKSKFSAGDLLGDEDPPEGPDSPPPPKQPEAKAAPRETPAPGTRSGGGGRSSARPQELKNFVTGVSGKIQALDGRPGRLIGLNADFTAGFDWGTGERAGVDGSTVYSAFTLYNQLNEQDKTWVDTVATAFEKAGSESPGGMKVLSDQALASSLTNAGVSVSRLDIAPTSPRLHGLKPTTGYSDDPVNAATGNFVEPETDFAFTGGCASLSLTRMYNSFLREAGAFGTGWTSWTEVGLVFDDESARMTLPDGRVVVFPRLGDAWDRATGESMWLERDEAADEVRATDNDGGTWRFTRSGTPLSHDRGEGTMVSFVHEDGRLVRLEHERGRHITLVWDGERVVAVETSDGRTMTYTYDEGVRLTAASGPLGTRSYRWNDAGLVDAVIDADGVVEVENTYDDQRRVTAQLSPHGRTSRYSYLPGNVTEVADPDGTRSNVWIHDNRGQLIGLVDSDGNRQSTSYDQHGNPVMITDRDGSVTVREYDDRGRLTREVRPSGADLQFEYDEHDRVAKVITEDAVSLASYNGASRNPSVMVDPAGGKMRLEWIQGLVTRLVDPTGVELRFDHNEHGDLVAVTNAADDTARLEYDAAGRMVAAITPSGQRTWFVHGAHGVAERHDPDGAVWRYEHSAAGRLTAVIDPMGARTTIEHGDDGERSRRIDPLGRATQQRFDDLGNLASIELPDGSFWRFTHDGLSRLTSTTTPDGQTWTRSYNEVGELVDAVTPTDDRIAVSADRASGTVVAQNASGAVTHRFDELGRPVSIEHPDGSVAVATYDECGRVVEQLDGEGSLTRIERDAAGRPVAVISATGDVTRFEYDACGRRSAVVDPLGARTTIEYDADSRPVRVTLPTGEVGWTRYDECGRVLATFRPGGGLSRYAYDAAGRVVEAKDSAHGLRRFTYDAAGQVVAATNGNGGVTRYEYDVRGRAVAITDPMGGVLRREFDEMDRCVAETDPLGRTTRAGYDAAGRQAWQEDARGHRTEWSYDGAGRVSSVTLDGRPLARISHDLGARTITVTDTTATDRREVVHQAEWNRRGQMVRRSRDDATMSWHHDAAGRRQSMTLPDGQRVGYSYDAASRLVAIDHPLLGRATMEHDASGRVIAATAGGLIQSWTYADGFVVDHATTDDEGSSRTVVERDDEGRILSIERGGEVTTYDYDAASQLIEARVGSDSTRWRYDASGRIVSETRAGESLEYSYDAGSQLLTVEGPDGTTRHDYDDLGRRVHTAYADGRTRDLQWSPTGWLATIVDEAGGQAVRTELHVDATGELASINNTPVFWDAAVGYAPPLAQVGATPVVPTGAVTGIGDTWTSPGWRGSRADAVDVWGVLGAAGAAAGAGLPAGVSISPAGQLTLGDLEWLGRRVYDSTTRGFLATDPLDPVTGAGWAGNPYSYAGNDPLHALDPTGLKPVSEADLEAANKEWYENAWDATNQWVKDNTDYIIGGLMVAGGVALMFAPIPGAQILGGAVIGMGADVISQRAAAGKDGQINVKQVLVSGAAGALTGGYGAYASSAVKAGAMTTAQQFGRTVAVEAGVGGVEGGTKYLLGDGDKSFGGFVRETAAGGVTGGGGAALSPISDAAGTLAARQAGAIYPNGATADIMDMTNGQVLAKGGGQLAVNTATAAGSSTVSQLITTGEVDPEKVLTSTAISSGTGAAKTFGGNEATIYQENRAARREVESYEYEGLLP